MATKREYRSDAFEAIHSAAAALHRVGAISKSTLGEFDALCLREPERLTPKQIEHPKSDPA